MWRRMNFTTERKPNENMYEIAGDSTGIRVYVSVVITRDGCDKCLCVFALLQCYMCACWGTLFIDTDMIARTSIHFYQTGLVNVFVCRNSFTSAN